MPVNKGKPTPDGGSRDAKPGALGAGAGGMKVSHIAEFESLFTIEKELGKGATSVVHKCFEKGTNRPFAVKKVKKTADMKVFTTEVSVLQSINHPHIIKLVNLYEDDFNVYLQLELVTGGELFERIVERGYYSERDAARCVREICQAVSYLHDHDIVHRDLKPENLLYADMGDEAPLKLADFGLSKIIDQDVSMKTVCGTPGYCAPEVLCGKPYCKAVDMWSVGVITYILLCGFEPFYDDRGDNYIYKKIIRADYAFISPWWDDISDSAKDFIDRLLVTDPKKRLCAEGALHHPWVREENSAASTKNIPCTTIENIKEFNAKRKLKAVAAAVIAMQRLGAMGEIIPAFAAASGGSEATTMKGAVMAAAATASAAE
ncbi:calcium/calmodulin-dependent protein kinase type IV [Strongylocentrotus purpuratus]|uniref:Protein kinase domain-containing protein n=1 Tax=Strongylocentrotus purpuratus TaxID=7668 RepID=A0A7M7N8R2_STRPU|nr:calcium/calmodulin-dependent protein kinase type IV [Strongylocentrotus purpuratus]|eukprot:XP_797065.2 PREDICTED: calcium/calmodulin-dependent protein kinase type IV [Strongylocentrotus purpuratus]